MDRSPAHADPLDALRGCVGTYAGHGINHEDEPFHSELEVQLLADGQGVTMKFRAVGIDGTVYHDERTWVARDDRGHLALWCVHTNGNGVRHHRQRHGGVREGADHTLVFAFGDPLARSTFREELALDLWPDGDLSYRVAWGLPGGDFRPRTETRLRPA